ncbi:MAG TPA: HD domain-containing protein [Chloroflexota bacterium]|nr:HD domain-containing protein [Chloroflexota bacterium]
MTASEFDQYVRALLLLPEMQELWHVTDRGMPVYAHVIDVTHLCLDRFESWQKKHHPNLNLRTTIVGCVLHDLTKGSVSRNRVISHSRIMLDYPDFAADVAIEAMRRVGDDTGHHFSSKEIDEIRHIVMSHHGPWGKVAPRTPGAMLVHECDLYSATNHRLAPVNANDILPLLSDGHSWSQAGVRLGVGRSVIKTRLQEACRAEGVRSWVDLLPIWEQSGKVTAGTPARIAQFERARYIIEAARLVPGTLSDRVRQLYPRAQDGDGQAGIDSSPIDEGAPDRSLVGAPAR